MSEGLLPSLLRARRPPFALGVAVGLLCVAAETLLVGALVELTPARAQGEVYVPGILLVSLVWGPWLGMATVVASGIAFSYFYIAPLMSFNLFSPREWLELSVFVVVALMVCLLAAMVRPLITEIDDRRRAADLSARMTRLVLGAKDLRPALSAASRLLSESLGPADVTIELGEVTAPGGCVAVPIQEGASRFGTLIVPAEAEPELGPSIARLRPSLVALLRAAGDRAAISRALDRSRDELRHIVEEQAALRRVATLVARGVSPSELFSAVASEMGRILKVETTAIVRYDPDLTMLYVGTWSARGAAFRMPVGSRWPVDEPSVAALVWETGQPARMTGYGSVSGEIAEWARKRGVACAVGCPIIVEGRMWGVMIAVSSTPEMLPEGVEKRMQEFTELLATAIGNAQARAQLAESRARVLATADDTRRRIERNLHDGTQQRLISLGLELRAAEVGLPLECTESKEQLARALRTVKGVVEELQEVSRGLHPAILSSGGLEPALKTLARRSPLPVELDLHVGRRPAERVEETAYYIVSEALTNIAKHARATFACVSVTEERAAMRLSIRDDGVGGADPSRGTGLLGLADRVAALGGTLDISSPAGGGTTLLVRLPRDSSDGPRVTKACPG
ncbi:DUF4118 domain-containing protein [Nonomuraea jiangxiensis]|uniref:histidine kinase n=1 Tax=Nonomuraea jiangxiensis TaxID=633440 RepID=A0A1G8W727_9ACTN|nr:DUF4118 domain-containing protein [Nonomuraea jiangxiensis]SDJ73916.1 GAF domain-containing protein [Nonomuraea jiangxiensis]